MGSQKTKPEQIFSQTRRTGESYSDGFAKQSRCDIKYILDTESVPMSRSCFRGATQYAEKFNRRFFIKIWCAAKRVPYTAKSNLASTRSSYLLLRAGALAAHRGNRLMLLGSPSDMVHSSRLRKTHPSTQGIGLNSKRFDPQKRDPPLL